MAIDANFFSPCSRPPISAIQNAVGKPRYSRSGPKRRLAAERSPIEHSTSSPSERHRLRWLASRPGAHHGDIEQPVRVDRRPGYATGHAASVGCEAAGRSAQYDRQLPRLTCNRSISAARSASLSASSAVRGRARQEVQAAARSARLPATMTGPRLRFRSARLAAKSTPHDPLASSASETIIARNRSAG